MTDPSGITGPGCVELLGADRVHGWVRRRPDGSFPLVEIRIHGRLVRELRVSRELEDGTGRFAIRLTGSLLRYVPGPSAVELSADGERLPVLETELPERPGALGVAELDARLAEGYFVTKFGGLRLPLELDLDWQDRTFEHYAHARRLMRELFDHDLHLAYGTLLGFTREGGFISSDDDFDTSYHSRATSARAVRAELFDIVTTLAARGEDVQLSGRKFIHWYSPRGAKLDVFPAWTDGPDYFQTHVVGGPYAEVFAAGYREVDFKGRPVSVPVDAEGALAATYGPGWQTPDPLFQWRIQPAARRAMRAVRITPGQLSLVQWERHFAATDPAEVGAEAPSELARLAAARLGRRVRAVVDLGCGDGRDLLAVAGDRPALGLDGSRAAVELASARAGTTARFERLDVADGAALRAALASVTSTGPVAVYARRLLDSVEPTTETTLRRVLRRSLSPGSLVFLEVATLDAPQPRLGEPLYRRISPAALVRRWTRDAQFALEVLEHDDDAGLARVVLRRRGEAERRVHALAVRARRRLARLRRRRRAR